MSDHRHLPTPVEAALRLADMNHEMAGMLTEYKRLQIDAANKKKSAIDTESRAFLTAEGSMDLRKWQARKEASQALFEFDLADRMVDVASKEIYALGRRMANGQTIGATSRKEFETLGADL